MPTIEKLKGLEILDSRGNPTIAAGCWLRGGAHARASVPSGASTGKAEAIEKRDCDPGRYAGRGCTIAAGNISGEISSATSGKDFPTQAALDEFLIALDGSPDKSRLGANAILGVSIAFARACAQQADAPLYEHFAGVIGQKAPSAAAHSESF